MGVSRSHLSALVAAVCLLMVGASPPDSGGLLAGVGGGLVLAQSPQAPGQGPAYSAMAEEMATQLAQAEKALEDARVAKGQSRTTYLEAARQGFAYVNMQVPGNPAAAFGLAEVAREMGDMKGAESYYRSYIELSEGRTDYRAYGGLGRVYLDSAYYRLALPQFRRAVQLNAASANAWDGLAQAFIGLREAEQAYEAVSQARELEPNNVEILRTFAQTCLGTVREDGRVARPAWLDEGLRVCNQGIGVLNLEWQKNPADTELLSKTVEFYEIIVTITESQLRASGQLNPELIIRLVRTRQQKQAIEHMLDDHQSLFFLMLALQTSPDDIALLSLAAEIARDLNLEDRARATCERILRLQPGNQEAREMLNEFSS